MTDKVTIRPEQVSGARIETIETMEAYQERVIAEKKELNDRADKLDRFIASDQFGNLPEAERERMKRQRVIMAEYSQVLGERIAAFTAPDA